MRYLKRRRRFESNDALEDPIAGVANLFDASIVFIVSMMLALFMAYNMMDLVNPNAEVTMTKKGADGQIEIITRKGKEIKVTKVTDKKMSGAGERLGTAYRLADGKVVYVPQ
ncbi:MAG: DUF2149 domain-containing protein [Gallionella sp.]|nr:DUF2149 domain-containing protein [Gallionella sp.]MDD4945983.1 DUF2149 domain-containing protein [Gallionella sp.]